MPSCPRCERWHPAEKDCAHGCQGRSSRCDGEDVQAVSLDMGIARKVLRRYCAGCRDAYEAWFAIGVAG